MRIVRRPRRLTAIMPSLDGTFIFSIAARFRSCVVVSAVARVLRPTGTQIKSAGFARPRRSLLLAA